MLLVGFLAGLAGVLSSNGDQPRAGRLRARRRRPGRIVFLAALIYGLVGYFAFGALVYLGEQLAGALGSYRRARHMLAFACAPLALSLVLWPVRLALYGEDNFRSGGSDSGTGGAVFEGIETAVVIVWCVALLALGIKHRERLDVARARCVAAAVPAIVPAASVRAGVRRDLALALELARAPPPASRTCAPRSGKAPLRTSAA